MGLRDIPGGGRGCLLADEMGLGKTLQCLALIYTLLKQGPYGQPVTRKVLIVTPTTLVKVLILTQKKRHFSSPDTLLKTESLFFLLSDLDDRNFSLVWN
jgi:hypothetical protein